MKTLSLILLVFLPSCATPEDPMLDGEAEAAAAPQAHYACSWKGHFTGSNGQIYFKQGQSDGLSKDEAFERVPESFRLWVWRDSKFKGVTVINQRYSANKDDCKCVVNCTDRVRPAPPPPTRRAWPATR